MSQADTEVLLRRWLAAPSEATLAVTIDALQRQPAAAWRQLATGLLDAGHAVAAQRLLEVAVAQFPQDPELRYLLGNALRRNGSTAAAERIYREVLRDDPGHRDAALALAFLLREQGRLQGASAVIAAVTRARTSDADETKAHLGFLRECGAFADGYALAAEARARFPEDPGIAAQAGEFALAIGDFAAARAAFRAALAREPQRASCWLRLAHCGRITATDDPDLARFRAAWRDPAAAPETRAAVGFALGKALDDLGDYGAAAQVFGEANALVRANRPWRAARWQHFVAQRLVASPLPALDPPADFQPIFVVGLPRTGTTLVARLLAQHFGVRDRGELHWIGAMDEQLTALGRRQDVQALAAAAALIRAQMHRDDAPARFYLDQNPLNFRYLDLIAALFPRARIVHCRRGPRDTALSLWQQYFAHEDMDFAYDFVAIADFFAGYHRLIQHWRNSLPLMRIELDYESLVTDPATTLARLARWLGQPAVAGPHAAEAIATASVWQARQPIYRHSIGRWRHYAAHLPELIERFAE
jgi:tetratricopeptide (TPR) repeat protein